VCTANFKAHEGKVVGFTATIKDHVSWQGVAETKLARPLKITAV
jgi:hypothetical protein